jgi:hypothetical protein
MTTLPALPNTTNRLRYIDMARTTQKTVLLFRNLATGHREPSSHCCLLDCLQRCCLATLWSNPLHYIRICNTHIYNMAFQLNTSPDYTSHSLGHLEHYDLLLRVFPNQFISACAHLFQINLVDVIYITWVRFTFCNRLPSILVSHGSVSQVIYIHEILYENALCISSLSNIKYLQHHEYVHAYVICTELFRDVKYELSASVIRERRP